MVEITNYGPQSFIYSPTDALVSCLKNIKIYVNPYPANVENMVSPNNASKRQMGFNWTFKGLKFILKQLRHVSVLQLHHHQGDH